MKTRFALALVAVVAACFTAVAAPESTDSDGPRFDVPKAEPAELIKWIDETRKVRLVGDTFEDRVKMALRLHEAITVAADQLLAEDAKASEEQAAAAVTSKIKALQKLGKLGDPSSLQRTQAFVASLSDDKRPAIAELFKEYDKKFKYADGKMPKLDHDDIDGSIAKMAEYLEKYDKLTQRHVGAAMSMARHLASHDGDREKAAEAYNKFAAALKKRPEEKLSRMAPRLEGLARQVNLLGKPMELEGAFVDGSKLDWSKYKGKVVLVDFWATWCGPCVAEIPNVLDEYEKYHDKGFEVLGISLDAESTRVEEFIAKREIPWKTLFGESDETRAWNHPMAIRYGVTGIPTAILVDQKGNVVSLSARGKELGKQLEKLLGAAAKK